MKLCEHNKKRRLARARAAAADAPIKCADLYRSAAAAMAPQPALVSPVPPRGAKSAAKGAKKNSQGCRKVGTGSGSTRAAKKPAKTQSQSCGAQPCPKKPSSYAVSVKQGASNGGYRVSRFCWGAEISQSQCSILMCENTQSDRTG